jgi:hypothetical protein
MVAVLSGGNIEPEMREKLDTAMGGKYERAHPRG